VVAKYPKHRLHLLLVCKLSWPCCKAILLFGVNFYDTLLDNDAQVLDGSLVEEAIMVLRDHGSK